jgi:predicted small integral membrane protein
MLTFDSFLLFKLVLAGGLALWMTVIVVNNLTAFAGGVASVGGLMKMQMFEQASAIRTPLLRRRVDDASWHRLAYSFVVAAEAGVAILLWLAAAGFGAALIGAFDAAQALAWANLAFAALLALGLMLTMGGAWFAYYIRQEGMQITHFALMTLTVVATVAINLK